MSAASDRLTASLAKLESTAAVAEKAFTDAQAAGNGDALFTAAADRVDAVEASLAATLPPAPATPTTGG